ERVRAREAVHLGAGGAPDAGGVLGTLPIARSVSRRILHEIRDTRYERRLKNILVIKLRYIGDVLLATPVLRALRDQFQEARVTILVNRGTEDIVKWNPDLNEVLVVDRRGAGEQVRFVRDIR